MEHNNEWTVEIINVPIYDKDNEGYRVIGHKAVEQLVRRNQDGSFDMKPIK